MIKNYLTLVFCMLSAFVFSQKFETNFIVAPTATFGEADLFKSEDHGHSFDAAFGFSVAIQEFYKITQRIAIGSELNYSNSNYKIIPNIYYGDGGPSYECDLNIQSLNIPLILRYQTLKKWMFQAGYGFTYILDSKIKVYTYYRPYTYNPVVKRERIQDANFDINGDFNSYYSLTFGKGFKIHLSEAMIQIYFEQSIHEYNFNHSWENPSDGNTIDYTFRPHIVGLRLGINL
jgi:hypothetical protein